MAQASAIQTFQQTGVRESLLDVVSTITRKETPLLNDLRKTKTNNVVHSWQTDTLSTGSANSNIQGADYSFTKPASRTLQTNYTQIFVKTGEVSGTGRAVDVAGVEDEYAYQKDKRMKELMTDIEKTLITGTSASGASASASTLRGFLSWITTNIESGTSTASVAQSETKVNNLLQTIWATGGRPDKAYVNGFQKRQITNFVRGSASMLQYNINLKEGGDRAGANVTEYESDFGVISITLDPFMDTDKTLVLQSDAAAVAYLRDIETVEVAKVADADRFAVQAELTLEVRNEGAHGKQLYLSTS